jgi:hypothetical protein
MVTRIGKTCRQSSHGYGGKMLVFLTAEGAPHHIVPESSSEREERKIQLYFEMRTTHPTPQIVPRPDRMYQQLYPA